MAMRIEERSDEVQASESAHIDGVTKRDLKYWIGLLRSPLWLCLLLALGIRVWLVVRTHGVIDGDESLVGIQAEHILRGELPIYFYGQPYLGSLEAYLIAIVFAITGPSVWTLRIEPLLLSLVVVWLTWRLAGALADFAQLPAYAKRTFMIVAALLAVIPPLYDGVIELRTFGGFIETFILMLLLLLSALQLTRRWQAGASRRELAWRWAGIGFIVGLGFWVYPLIISAVIAAATWIVWYCLTAIVRSRRQARAPARGAPTFIFFETLAGLFPTLAAIPACLIGFAPSLYWGATNQWQNISYVLGLGGGTSVDRLSTIRKVTRLYLTCVAPRVIGGAVPKEDALLSILNSPLLAVGVLCIFATAILVVLSFLSPHPILMRVQQLSGLPLLFAVCSASIFCLSTVSASGLISTCDADFAGRYATPLLLALPFFFASIFTVISMYIHEMGERQGRNVAEVADSSVAGRSQVSGQAQDSRAAWSEAQRLRPGIRGMPSNARPAPTRYVLQIILFAFLVVYLGAQAWTYGLTDAAGTFQSPFCLEAPANNDSIIAYMQREHIHYAWAANLLGYPIVFKTNGDIIIANPLALTTPPLAINRIPAYTAAVQHADRASMLVFAQHDDLHPALLMMLDAEQVTYRVARFPSELGIDVLVVTPLNRSVLPFESRAFNEFFICSE